jgi:hypothetical protein
MLLGVAVASAVYTTTLRLTGEPGAAGILGAAGAGQFVGSGVALLAAVASATRPGRDAARDHGTAL